MGNDSKETSDSLIELLDTVPHLQILQCEFLLEGSFFLYTMIDLFKALSWAPPTLPGGIAGFLYELQSFGDLLSYHHHHLGSHSPYL